MKKATVYILLAVMLMTALCGCREDTVNATSSPMISAPISPSTDDDTNNQLDSDPFDGDNDDQDMILSPSPEDGFVHDGDGILDDNGSGNGTGSGTGNGTGNNSGKSRSGNNSSLFGSNNSR